MVQRVRGVPEISQEQMSQEATHRDDSSSGGANVRLENMRNVLYKRFVPGIQVREKEERVQVEGDRHGV